VTTALLRQHLESRLDARQSAWLQGALEISESTQNNLLRLYTEASSQLGRAPLALTEALDAALPLEMFAHWTLEDAGRLLLLLTRCAHHDAGAADAVACFEQGDTREQQSWLRGVAHLPNPAQYLPVVIETCRTNILPLFEAVACENPFPARHFPELNFNQMVLKALFNSVALARIYGLADRANPELTRMASDYADERRAAGRSIPADIGLAMSAARAERNPS
jgi:hypothetical protein